MIDITGIDKATLVAELFNNSKPQGLGFFASGSKSPMTKVHAQQYLDRGQTYFDYLEGRVMKVNVSENTLNPAMYDRDNGAGSANRVVEAIKNAQPVAFKEAMPATDLERAAAAGSIEEALGLAGAQMNISASK